MRVTLLLFLLAAMPSAMAAADNKSVENDSLRLEVSPENGSPIRIFDKHTQTEYVTQPGRTRLFRLLVPKLDYLSRRINSWEQTAASVEAHGDELKIKFHDLQISQDKYIFQSGSTRVPEPKLPIDVEVTFRLHGEHILASIEVTNRSLEQITDVTFPWIDGLAASSDGKPARVVIPSLSQKIVNGALDFLLGERAKPYPALLATSWINFEFAGKGVGLEVRLPSESQDGLVSMAPNLFAPGSPNFVTPDFPYIGWNFYPHISGQGTWKSPEIVIHVHAGDWHLIAGEHREWFREHYPPQTDPAFSREIGVATYRLKKSDNTVNWTYDEIPQLAEQAQLAGMRSLVIEGWRAREGPGNDAPFAEVADPGMGGGERLKTLIDKLQKERQIELIFAFHPAVLNTASKQYKDGAIRWAVKTRRQANQPPPDYTSFTVDYPYQEQVGHDLVSVDPASPATDFLLKEAERLKDNYGFRNLFLRGVGLQSYLSYNHEDAVPPQKVYDVGYARFLGGLRKIFPQGLLLTEGFNDLVNRYGNAGYTWIQSNGSEILAYSIPWKFFSNDVEALDYDQANASFSRKTLINLIIDGGDGTVGRYPAFAQHLKALLRLKEATAPYYADAEFRDHDGLKNVAAESGTVVSVFENQTTHQKGLVFANLSDQKKKVSVQLDLRSLAKGGHFFHLSGRQEQIELTPQTEVELDAREVAILGVDP